MNDPFAGKAKRFDRYYDDTLRGRVRFRILREQLREVLPAPPVDILDAGGGPGRLAAGLCADGHRVTLLDPSEEMLDLAGKALALYAERSRVVRGLAEDAPTMFGPAAFDAALLVAVICYVAEPGALLGAMASVVKPGGALSVVFKNRAALPFRHAAEGKVTEALRSLDDPAETGNLGVANRARSCAEVREALDLAGFDILGAYGVRAFADLVPGGLGEADEVELVALELRVAGLEPYRSVSRLLHLAARRRGERSCSRRRRRQA